MVRDSLRPALTPLDVARCSNYERVASEHELAHGLHDIESSPGRLFLGSREH